MTPLSDRRVSGPRSLASRVRNYPDLYTPSDAAPSPVRLVGPANTDPPIDPDESTLSVYARVAALLEQAVRVNDVLVRENAILRLCHDRIVERQDTMQQTLASLCVTIDALRETPPVAALVPVSGATDPTVVQAQAEEIGRLREALARAEMDAVVKGAKLVNLPPKGVALSDIVAAAIEAALERSGGRQDAAAELLRVSPRVLNYKLHKSEAGVQVTTPVHEMATTQKRYSARLPRVAAALDAGPATLAELGRRSAQHPSNLIDPLRTLVNEGRVVHEGKIYRWAHEAGH